jgi:hypothetical protein
VRLVPTPPRQAPLRGDGQVGQHRPHRFWRTLNNKCTRVILVPLRHSEMGGEKYNRINLGECWLVIHQTVITYTKPPAYYQPLLDSPVEPEGHRDDGE